MHTGPWTDAEIAYLRRNYSQKLASEIAADLNRTAGAVRQRAQKYRLISFKNIGAKTMTHDYFADINCPMQAYLLGLLAADGHISDEGQLKLEVHAKDGALVELAKAEIAPNARLAERVIGKTPLVRFMVQSPRLAADLARFGVVPRKSRKLFWPGLAPKLQASFIAGYFDGDGSLNPTWIYRWTVVSGSPGFLEGMQAKILEHTGVRVGGLYRDKRSCAYSLVQTGKPVRAIDAWMRADVPGLARKRLPANDDQGGDLTRRG